MLQLHEVLVIVADSNPEELKAFEAVASLVQIKREAVRETDRMRLGWENTNRERLKVIEERDAARAENKAAMPSVKECLAEVGKALEARGYKETSKFLAHVGKKIE